MKKRGILLKVFAYTTLFLIVIVCVTVGLFSQQFLSFYNTTQTQQLYNSYQILHDQLHGKDHEGIIRAAEDFYRYNQSFQFYIRDSEGQIIFSTPDMDTSDDFGAGSHRIRMSVGPEHTLFAVNQTVSQANYSDLFSRSLLALCFMLAAGVLGAFIFARQMTNPIKRLAGDTKRMANLEDVLPAPERRDEIGTLTRDVHSMYNKLKEAIETQRYFFSAASHELKTPIAAASVLMEGMLENVGDYKDHPKYLRECIKLMDAQSKIITEILELVSLDDGRIIPDPEELELCRIVAAVLPSYQTLAEAGGLHIAVDVPEEQTCFADAKMLKKVLSNVILNAVQNTPSGGEIRIRSESNADQYRLCVLNTGTHIDKGVLPKLFDPFYRSDKARSRKNGNTGLGLTIVQKALDAMDVDFALENTSDGVLFWMDLPET